AESTRKSNTIPGGAAEPAAIHEGIWQAVAQRRAESEEASCGAREDSEAAVDSRWRVQPDLGSKEVRRKPALTPKPTGLLPSEAVRRMMQTIGTMIAEFPDNL